MTTKALATLLNRIQDGVVSSGLVSRRESQEALQESLEEVKAAVQEAEEATGLTAHKARSILSELSRRLTLDT